MRRIVMSAVMMSAIVMLVAGVAAAAIVRCSDDRCFGTQQEDRIFERQGEGVDDFIASRGKGDVINAAEFNKDEDDVRSQRGNDRVRVDDGDTIDSVNCGPGNKDIAIIDVDRSERASDAVNGNCEEVMTNLDTTSLNFSTASVKKIKANSEPVE